jgi:hypothetical protein
VSVKQRSSTGRHSRVVHPDEAVAAALIAVLTAAEHAAEPAVAHSAWADPAYRLRTPPHPGPGAWRYSARPH